MLDTRPGIEREIKIFTMKGGKLSQEIVKKSFGAEKKKLFPTDMGMMVNDFLVKNFPGIVDYHFTADVEEQFDQIAHGKTQWQKMLKEFYGPFHSEVVKIADIAERVTGERELGKHPKSGKVVLARMGRYGPIVQIGAQEDEDKKFAKIRKGWSLEDITLEQALECFALPRDFGEYNGESLQVNIGKFGPYVRR